MLFLIPNVQFFILVDFSVSRHSKTHSNAIEGLFYSENRDIILPVRIANIIYEKAFVKFLNIFFTIFFANAPYSLNNQDIL